MSEWPERPLGDLLEVIIDHRGKTPKKLGGTDFTDRGVPVVSAIHIKGGRIEWSERERYVPQWMFEKWMPERLRKGDVLLTSEAPLGAVAQVTSDDDLVLSQRLFALRGKSGVLDSGYLRYFLESAPGQHRLTARSTGTTATGIRQAELVKIAIPLPPLEEQRRIAGALGALDDLMDTNRRLTRTVEDHMLALFARAGFDSVPSDEDETLSLADLVELNPTLSKPVGEAAYVDMSSLPTDSSRIGAVVRRKATGGARFQNGDTLMARLTPSLENGKAAFVDVLMDGEVAVGSTEFVVMRDHGKVGEHWPYVLTRSQRFRDYAIANMNGSSGRQRVSARTLGVYVMKVPDPTALDEFRRVAAGAFAAIKTLHEEVADLTRTRDELLPLLMSGQVRVSVPSGAAA